MSSTIQIISIEGNIGSGKSTLLANLKKHFAKETNIIFLREPVDEWSNIKDENGVTILEKFYTDQNKYAFSFQMMAYISRLKLLKDTITEIKNKQYKDKNRVNYFVITERSLYTDKMVFAKMLYDSGKIENINYQIYLNWFNAFAGEFHVNKIIYVRTQPEICHQRISIRSREGEDNIPLDYLKSCNVYHEVMLDKNSNECICKNQVILDGNHNIYENEEILNEWIKKIENIIINIYEH
jgi:deoxyadenosine/deoxycytidine kinase